MRGIAKEGAGKTDALALAARKRVARGSQQRVVAGGKRQNQLMHIGHFRGLDNFLIIHSRREPRNIFGDRPRQHVGVLR